MKTTLLILGMITCGSLFAQNNDSSAYFLQKGREEKESRRYLLAYQHLQRSVTYAPDNLEAHRELGNVSMELRKYDVARNSYARVLQNNPDDQVLLQHMTNLSFWTRKYEDAIAHGKKLIDKKQGERVHYIVGKSYYELENYGEAFKYLHTASREEPNNAEIPYLFARAMVEMSNYRNAVQFYQKAISLDTTKPRWVYEMAMTYAAIPDDKSAVTYYEKAAAMGYKMDNDFVENLALSCVLSGQAEKGIALMKQLLDKKPADLNLLYNLAETYYKINRYEEAIEYWDRILYYDKQDARALYMIGMAYQKKGDKDKGIALCDKAIELDPSLAGLKQKRMNIGL